MKNQSSSTLISRTVVRFTLCILMTGILVPAALFTPGESAAAEETLYVKVLVARVRQAPNTDSPIAFRIRRGDRVIADRKQGEWYHIKHFDGQTGWAHQKLFISTALDGQAAAGQIYTIKSVRVSVDAGKKETIAFQMDGFQPPEAFVLKGDRPRVVCDFLNTRLLGNVGNRVEPKGTLIKDIRIAPYGGGAPRVRVVLDLTPGRSYVVDQTFYKKENRYTVTIAAEVP
jgi:SH3-like domain-containing protein